MIAAKYYIKDKQLSNYQCSSCFGLDYEFLVPDCACRLQLCKKCFYLWYAANQTIHICAGFTKGQKKGEFVTKPAEFVCPSQECPHTCRSQRQFSEHCIKCPLIKGELREQFYLKANYMCKGRHRLQFSTVRQACSLCYDDHNYSNVCTECKAWYCTSCRPTPCSKRECAKGHQLFPGVNIGYLNCDICSISVRRLTTNQVFSDRRCNFDVCKSCYQKLPDYHPLPLLREYQPQPSRRSEPKWPIVQYSIEEQQ